MLFYVPWFFCRSGEIEGVDIATLLAQTDGECVFPVSSSYPVHPCAARGRVIAQYVGGHKNEQFGKIVTGKNVPCNINNNV